MQRVFWGCLCAVIVASCASPRFQPSKAVVGNPEFTVSHFRMSDGYVLPFRNYEPATPSKQIVLALHGFNDYSRAFEPFCAYMLKQRVQCIAYDQRGFGNTEHVGLWPGPDRLQKDLRQIIELLQSRYPEKEIYLAGESMGGAVILSALADDKSFWRDSVDGAILFAPAVWARETQPWYQQFALWLAVHTFPDWKPTGESLEIVATDNIEALREMGRDPYVIKETRIDTIYGLTNLMDLAFAASGKQDVDLLVLYGEKDEVIPKYPTCQMLASFRNQVSPPKVKLYAEGYHMLTRDLQAERVFRDIESWIIARSSLEGDDRRMQAFCAD